VGANSGTIRIVVCDAGPLIHLDELGALALLGEFPQILVPQAVWAEVERHRPSVFGRGAPSFTRAKPRRPADAALVALSRLFPLHAGETQALQIAAEEGADLLLTDDTAARLAARQLGLPVHGTIGILLRAVRRREWTPRQAADVLREIPTRSTLHINPALLDEILAEVERFGHEH
jgi:predicted nucleic acid-binding protein